MNTLIVVKDPVDVSILRESLPTAHVCSWGQAMTGYSYGIILLGAPSDSIEQLYLDEVLRPRLDPSGSFIFI